MRRLVLIALLGLAVASTAAAKNKHHGNGTNGGGGNGGTQDTTRSWVPEFDPATVGAVAVVLAGGGLVLARRRKR